VLKVSRYCASCGTQIPGEADFCPNCGQKTAPEETEPRAEQTTEQPAGMSAAQMDGGSAGATVGTRPTTTPEPPEPQTPPIAAPPQGGQQQAPLQQPQKKSRRGLIIGGCLGLVALGTIILLVVGVIAYIALRDDGGNSGNNGQQGQQGQQGEQQGGSLKSFIQEEVGDFQLQEVAEWPEAVDAGASEAYSMLYAGSDGASVIHSLAAFSSPEAAEEVRAGVVQSLVDGGMDVLEETPREADGQQVGKVTLLQGESESGPVAMVVWTNGQVYAASSAPIVDGDSAAIAFFQNSPY
jgi:hypothetical protein